MTEYISGTVHSVMFSDESQPFYIFSLNRDDPGDPESSQQGGIGSRCVAKGSIAGAPPRPGSWIGAEGSWVDDPKFGHQFLISRAPVLRGGMTPEAAENLLRNQGVGPRTVAVLKAALGDSFMSSLEDEKALTEVPGVTPLAAAQVALAWKKARAFFSAIPKMEAMGFGTREINRIFTVFGDESIDVLTTDPWALVEVPGFGFSHADQVAASMGIPMDDPGRIIGACSHAVRTARKHGHVMLPLSSLLAAARDTLGSSVPDAEIATALKAADEAGRILIDRGIPDRGTLVYTPDMHRFEMQAAEALLKKVELYFADYGGDGPFTALFKHCCVEPQRHGDPDEFYSEAAKEAMESLDIDLTDTQFKGVVKAMTHPVSVITGLPGTGKTTSLRVLVKALQIAGVSISGSQAESGCLLMAPTGIAAKRISHITGAEASTIHRALGGSPGSTDKREAVYEGISGESDAGARVAGGSVWSYGSGNTHPAKIVVIDESSMLDMELLWRVLEGTRPDAHIVFVGDAAQLPSVGPGNIMRDLVSCGIFPVTDLREIFRQEEASDIVIAAHAIHAGGAPPLEGDFRLIAASSEAAALEIIKKVTRRLYDTRSNFQVLSPRHGGVAGVTNLNSELRDMINPPSAGSREIRIASGHVREGDRVMVVQNDYDLGVYNGDVGKVTGIDLGRKRIEVKIHGPRPYRISTDIKTAARLLRLAYAQTVHKSQGQEYDVIVLPVLESFGFQLQRNLFYTAVTRAKSKVVLVGQESAMLKAIANDKQAFRYTALSERIAAKGGPSEAPSRNEQGRETTPEGGQHND